MLNLVFALQEGVSKYSTEKQNIPWRKILEFGCRVFDKTRTPVDLKDKWKNIISKEGKITKLYSIFIVAGILGLLRSTFLMIPYKDFAKMRIKFPDIRLCNHFFILLEKKMRTVSLF